MRSYQVHKGQEFQQGIECDTNTFFCLWKCLARVHKHAISKLGLQIQESLQKAAAAGWSENPCRVTVLGCGISFVIFAIALVGAIGQPRCGNTQP